MKERGIIFNAEMVRAILDGRKTQTRRVMEVQPVLNGDRWEVYSASTNKRNKSIFVAPWGSLENNCPYGKVGDHLWVRETFALLGNEDGVCVDWNDNILKTGEEQAARIYKASCEQKDGDYGLWSIPDDVDWKPHTDNHKYDGTWTPSIHMPRWASRITLEITDVRVEKIQNMSETDAISEGVQLLRDGQWKCYGSDSFEYMPTALGSFSTLWNSIYGEFSWMENPWVWVVEFKRV